MAPERDWVDHDFRWSDYAPDVRPSIALARERARRLTQCSIPGCKKARISIGVAVPPVLRSSVPTTLKARGYGLCKAHDALTADEVGDALYGPAWREHDAP